MTNTNGQVGGNHYQHYAIQPYELMFRMNGAQAHIASYILRTKNPDDLDKAIHWCQLVLAAPIHETWVVNAEQITYLCEWFHANQINPYSPVGVAVTALMYHDYTGVIESVQSLKEMREKA